MNTEPSISKANIIAAAFRTQNKIQIEPKTETKPASAPAPSRQHAGPAPEMEQTRGAMLNLVA